MSLLLLAAAYLLGSIPSGLLIARQVGVDVRRVGSGNIGATNVARAGGPRLGVATLIADALKGALPVLVARGLWTGAPVEAATGLLAFLGHVFPITLRLRGGKGVATALGALLALCPLAMPVPVAVFLLTLAASRYVSVSSAVAAVVAPVAIGLLAYPRAAVGAAAVMGAVILARHRDNLRRLLAGVEPRVSLHKNQAPPTR